MTKLIWKALVIIIALAGLAFIYFRNAAKSNSTMKFGNRVATDPRFALSLSQELNSLVMEISGDHETIHDKLSRLCYELDVFFHRVYKCYRLNDYTFLLITTYENADTNSSHGVGNIVMLNYKVELNKEANTVKVYSNELPTPAAVELKKSFVKGLFRQYVGIYVE